MLQRISHNIKIANFLIIYLSDLIALINVKMFKMTNQVKEGRFYCSQRLLSQIPV